MAITKRKLGNRLVNPVGLGCMSLSWAFGVPPADEYSETLLNKALDAGYDHFDTARMYGLGHNEELIGRAISHRREEFFLASKTGIFADGSRRWVDCRPAVIMEALETSLRLLKTDHIDLYYLHRPDPVCPIEESIEALAGAVKAGKIGGIGLSEMSADTLRRAAAVHPIAAMQTEYSPMTRNPEIAVLEACRELGTTFVAFSPVGRGALPGVMRDPSVLPPKDMRHVFPRFNAENWPKNLRLVDGFADIARDCGVTPAQLAMAWVIGRADHIVTIPGTANIEHMQENIARWDYALPQDAEARIDALINRHSVAGGRYNPTMQATVTTEEFEPAISA